MRWPVPLDGSRKWRGGFRLRHYTSGLSANAKKGFPWETLFHG